MLHPKGGCFDSSSRKSKTADVGGTCGGFAPSHDVRRRLLAANLVMPRPIRTSARGAGNWTGGRTRSTTEPSPGWTANYHQCRPPITQVRDCRTG